MRAFILMMAAAGLAVVSGCDIQNQNNERELAEAPVSAPRTNLYPLTSPPPGSVQPLQGYAPTRITATQYGPEVYRDGTGNVQLADRNPAEFQGFGFTEPAATTAYADPGAPAYANPDRQAAYAAAVAAGAAMTYPAGYTPPATYGAYAAPVTTASLTTATASTTLLTANGVTYNPNDPNDPYYCPPGAEFCPVPGSPAPTVATPAASFGLDATQYAAAPVTTAAYQTQTASYTAPVTTVAAPSYQTAAYVPTTPTYQSATYTAPIYAATAATYTPPVIQETAPTPAPASTSYAAPETSYAPPMRLSATAAYAPPPAPAYTPPAYTPPAYTPPAYTPPPARMSSRGSAASSYQRQMPVGLHFGEVEGTADIVGPLPSLDPVVRPAYGGYSAPAYPVAPMSAPASNYSAPYVRPLSASPAPSPEIYAMAAAAPTSTPVPVTSAPAAPARRPVLLSSSVAGASVRAGDTTGYSLVPAPDVPPGNHPNDFGPSQWFEVVRPGNGAVRIGRISATCTCVGARIPKRFYEAGERILVEARMLSKPAANNLTYGLYVNIAEPVETVVDADVTLRY